MTNLMVEFAELLEERDALASMVASLLLMDGGAKTFETSHNGTRWLFERLSDYDGKLTRKPMMLSISLKPQLESGKRKRTRKPLGA